ncbi:MAG: flagellar M-ring protein FliF [Clostridia bacterium]|nr:flagellar M-ring protein FliF [Clostridia bacterium]
MPEKVKQYWEKFREFLKKIPKKVFIITGVVVAALVLLLAVMIFNRPWTVLFTGLTTEEVSTILSYLEEQGVTDYRVENNDTVMVPKNLEPQLKANLLVEFPEQGGFGYSTYFERVGALSTESERSQAFIIALGEKMEAVIRCMDGVRDAHVQLTPGEDLRYVLDSGNVIEATASVMVTMEGAQRLTSAQANAIRQLVAKGVQGLRVESVAIVDNFGNSYSNTTGSLADSEASSLKIMLEEQWENKIRTNVMQVLVPFFGNENVSVGVDCEVEVAMVESDKTDVWLPDWADDGSTNGRGILGAEIFEYYVDENGNVVIGGLVGAETNADLPEYIEDLADPNGNETSLGGSGTREYDNPREETHKVSTAGFLTDCSVSVSINSTTAGNVDVEALRLHVARASGIEGLIDEETGVELLEHRISIIALPFYDPDEPLPGLPGDLLGIPMWAVFALAAGLVLFLILLIVILSIRKKRRKKKEEEEAALAQQDEVAAFLAASGLIAEQKPTTGADVMSLQSERSLELRQDIRSFADTNPEIAAQMIRNWLRGGDDNG